MNIQKRSLVQAFSIFLFMLLGAATASAQESEGENQARIEELTVTGSHIDSGANATSPIEIISGERLEEAARPTLSDFLRVDVTQNIAQDTGITNSGFQGRLQGNRNASVNLRGLGKENNLVLLDSDRMVHYAVPDDNGWRSADVNNTIPRILIKQTELLLDGGSALYGTDAIAGVVNLIPNYDLRGYKLNFSSQHFEQDADLADMTLAFAGGWGNDETSFILGAETQRTPAITNWMLEQRMPDLSGAEANFVYHTFGVREFNGLSGSPQPGEAVLSDPLCGQNDLFGMYPIEAGLVNGTSGDGFDGYETCSLARGLELFNYKIETDSDVLFVGLEHDFSDRLSGKFNISYGKTAIHNTYWNNQTFTEWRALNYDDALIPVNHPLYGTHPAVEYYDQQFPTQGWTSVADGWSPGPAVQIINFGEDTQGGHESMQNRIAGQLNYSLSNNWNLKLNSIYGESEVNATRRAVIAEHAIMALRGLGGPNCDVVNGTPGQGGCEWFNPFMSSGLADADSLGLRNSREMLDFILPNDNRKFTAELFSTQAVVSGTVESWQMAGGPVSLALGYEFRWEQEGVDFDDFLNGNGVVYGVGGNTYDDQGNASMIDYEESDRV
ncbi:MAG: TonB-dependent receptor plug domain-containing protein, partial [Ketobacter sp.]